MSASFKPDDLTLCLQEAIRRFVQSNPRSQQQHARAASVLPGGNTRTVLFADPFPIALVSAAGARVISLDGREYVDFLGEYTAGLYGHTNPAIASALKRAIDGGIVLGGHTCMEEEFAGLLRGRFPSLERLRFTNSGTEANLMAISAARATTGRSKIVVFEGAYHGSVFSFGNPANPLNAPFEFVVAPYNDIETSMDMMADISHDVAAVIVEPMLGSGGCIPAEVRFLQSLRSWCSQHAALLIFDEVMTSRLAPGGLQTLHGIRPDLTTLGKYLGGGLSFGAFGGRAEIMNRFDPRVAGSYQHAGTFNNNVLTMAAGIAGLTEVLTVDALVALNARGETLRAKLNELAAADNVSIQFTGMGSMMNVHMCARPIRNYRDAARGNSQLRDLLYFDLLEDGIWCARRGMFNLSLAMQETDFESLYGAISAFVARRRGLLGEHR